MAYSRPTARDPVSRIAANDSLSGEAIERGEALYYSNPLNYPKHQNREFVERLGLTDLWIIPILLGTKGNPRPYGTLAICAAPEAREYKLGQEEVELLSSLTNLIERHCPSLDRDRIANRIDLGRRLDESFPQFWNRVAQSAGIMLGFDGFSVFVADRTEERIRRVGSEGVDIRREHPEALLSDGRVEYKKEQSGTGHFFAEPKTVYSQDYYKESWYHGPSRELFPEHYGTTLMGTPIFETPNGRVIGILRANDKRSENEPEGEERISQDDVSRIESVAKELSPIVQHFLNAEDNRVLWALASHDMRGPINVVRDAAGTILNRDQTRSAEDLPRQLLKEDRRDLNNIIHNTGLSQLLVDMLATTAEETIKYEFELLALFRKSISNIVSLLGPTAQNSDVDLHYGGFWQFPRLWLDRKRIEMVLYNLLINAIKYAYKGTTVRVAWDVREGDYVVHIRNDGPGVPEAEKDRIFQPFRRASNAMEMAGEGRGLGLFIVRRIMKDHGGDVTLSRLRNPTIFTLRFPKDLHHAPPEQCTDRG